MAMNRNMTMAEKEVRDYAQRQMERAEQWENILFTEEQKEQVLEYAAMTGDDYDIRKMIRDLADAVRSSDEEKVDEILRDAREEIDEFPDRSVGMAELKGYGYTADDMFPLLWSSFFVTFLANKIKLLSASILAVSATLDNGAEGYYQIVADSDDLKNRFFFLVSVE